MSWVVWAALFGTSAVLFGAYGAHMLQASLTATSIAAFRTAAHYHLMHSVVLLALGLYGAETGRSVRLPASLITVGTVCFSGSIYGLVLGGPSWLGPVTPLGGLLLVAGWLSLIVLARSGATR